MKMNRSTKTWQVIGVIVSVLSISWGIYQHTQRQEAEALSIRQAGIILRQAMHIVGLQKGINEANATIKTLRLNEDSLVNEINETRKQSAKHLADAIKYRAQVDKLNTQLNETYPVIDINDMEHLRLFLGWAR